MAERAGGWIEQVERRGWTEFVYVGPGGVEFRSIGPFAAGFVLRRLVVGGQETTAVVCEIGFALSGSGAATEENFRAGQGFVHSDNRRWGKPVFYGERLHYYPEGMEIWPEVGQGTGSWYLIFGIHVVTQSASFWSVRALAERRRHEWRWAPADGAASGGASVELE